MGNRTQPLIAVLGGDGIGPEVTEQAERVLAAVRPDCRYAHCLVGGAAIARDGAPLPSDTVWTCADADAILFGAVGGTEFDGLPLERRPEAALLGLRKSHDLYANVRPARAFPGSEGASSLRPELVRGLDLIVLRELTSGLYYGRRSDTIVDGVRTVSDEMVYREPEVERIVRFGFELARGRRKHLTSVDKVNVLATSRLWREVTERVARDYPDVALEHLLVDNAAMQLVRAPARFDVIVTENTFGDILSDEAAMLTGSIGNLPSASLGARVTGFGRYGMYEPVSGTAPDIAGTGVANPVAAILSAAMLARYSLSDERAARRIEEAVDAAMSAGVRTADMAGESPPVGTAAFGDRILRMLAASQETVPR